MSSLREKHKNVLIIVLVINAALFVVEATSALLANSTALLADSLDMLGDSLVYGFSLYVIWRSAAWKAKAALLKGAIMALFGAGVLLEVIHKTISGIVPGAGTMGIIGVLVLLGNAICFLLLYRHRTDDLNMRSTWLCSRNDIIANVSVLVAAAGVAILNSQLARYPDRRRYRRIVPENCFGSAPRIFSGAADIKIPICNRRMIIVTKSIG